MGEYVNNHWVIKHDNYILYYTKDSKDINSMNNHPPGYEWKYIMKKMHLLYQNNITYGYLW